MIDVDDVGEYDIGDVGGDCGDCLGDGEYVFDVDVYGECCLLIVGDGMYGDVVVGVVEKE